MNVLMISLFSDMPHHVSTEMEILQRHIDDGDDVSVLGCMGELPACMHKKKPEPRRCRECLTSRSRGILLLSKPPKTFVLDAYYTAEDRAKESSIKTQFDSVDEVKDYVVDGFDLGYGALSSTVYICRDSYLQSQESRDMLGRMCIAAYRTFCSVREFLRVHPETDRVYLFNGRFATCRGAFRACQQAGVDVRVHERASSNAKFMVFDNVLPHNLEARDRRIRDLWEQSTEEEREIGHQLYKNRRERVEFKWHSHTKEQQAGRLPESFDANRRNVIVYTSSDDEYVAIGKEWVTPGFSSQSEAIQTLHQNLRKNNSDVFLYVRMHPHLKGVDNKDTRLLYSLSGENLEVILPESPVCSYALLDGAEKIVTFGSTVGIEATYWGKPSILAGMNFYRSLGGNYIANSDDELLELVESQLEPKPQEPALMFGLDLVSYGEPFKYYEATGFDGGFFKGKLMYGATGRTPMGFLLPSLWRSMGDKPGMRNAMERVLHMVGYQPFELAFKLGKRLLGTNAN